MKPATLLALVIVTLIAVLHLLRFILRVEVTVGGAVVPLWVSLPATLFFAALAVGLWREHMAPGAPAA